MNFRDEIQAFCASYGPGWTIVWDPAPSKRTDALGLCGATDNAQLCSGRVIAAKPVDFALHCIAHEIGHGMVAHRHGLAKLEEESLVIVEQVSFLQSWSRHLFDEASKREEELRRLRSLAQSLQAGAEDLPGWAGLRVAAMVEHTKGHER